MLKLLLKKQLAEVFRGYFHDTKKNKARSKAGVIGMFVLFGVIMVGVLGGMFTVAAVTLCQPMLEAGMGWFYFVIMSGLAIALGAFGSIFSTYAGLYLSKDNDLLLSLPVPVKDIIASRLLNVFLMGALYASTAILPTLIVYWIKAGATVPRVVCGLVLALNIFLIVLILSCLLGWCVAKISQKLKNKSFVTVLASLLFIGAYYVFYFRANDLFQNFTANAVSYGEKVRGAAGWLYVFGRSGEGDFASTGICLGVVLVLLALTWIILNKTFLSIATAAPSAAKKVYKEKTVRGKNAFGALLSRELAKFTATPSYMLNCGLGVLILPAFGVFLLIKADMIVPLAEAMFSDEPVMLSVILGAALMLAGSMNDMSEPSVSLEGKSIWIPQSLPVSAKTVLRSKASLQLILTGVPMLFTLICLLVLLPLPAAEKALLSLIVLFYVAFSALFGTVIGVRMANLTWTNELAPIKQSFGVVIAIFSGWILAAAFAGLYFWIASGLGRLYLVIWAVLLFIADLLLLRILDTKSAKRFAAL